MVQESVGPQRKSAAQGDLTVLWPDDFLGRIVGRETFRVEMPPSGLDAKTIEAIRAAQVRPVFLYVRVPTTATKLALSLQNLGFAVVDTNVTLERNISLTTPSPSVRHAAPQDRDRVVALAARSFEYSRLHLDPRVPRTTADLSRAEWVANFFAGRRGDGLAIVGTGADCDGFLLWLGPTNGVLIIDLIAVAPEARRRGLARKMIDAVEAMNPDARMTRVGTQIANVPSLRLYEGMGFRVVETRYILHYHGFASTRP
jgi:ribosomal protein S18 acetylase RimI-like enzyme